MNDETNDRSLRNVPAAAGSRAHRYLHVEELASKLISLYDNGLMPGALIASVMVASPVLLVAAFVELPTVIVGAALVMVLAGVAFVTLVAVAAGLLMVAGETQRRFEGHMDLKKVSLDDCTVDGLVTAALWSTSPKTRLGRAVPLFGYRYADWVGWKAGEILRIRAEKEGLTPKAFEALGRVRINWEISAAEMVRIVRRIPQDEIEGTLIIVQSIQRRSETGPLPDPAHIIDRYLQEPDTDVRQAAVRLGAGWRGDIEELMDVSAGVV